MNAKRIEPPLPGRYRHCAGLTLLEVLIGMLVLSIGLLGLAGLQTASLRFNTSAYYRTQATSLAYDFADRLRANRDAALDGEYDDVTLEAPPPACDDDFAIDPDAAIDAQDEAAWRNALACALPSGTGSVTRIPANDEFTITVQWDEARGEAADDNAVFGEMTFSFTTRL
jgi:type IV pilus assembly protein PilV